MANFKKNSNLSYKSITFDDCVQYNNIISPGGLTRMLITSIIKQCQNNIGTEDASVYVVFPNTFTAYNSASSLYPWSFPTYFFIGYSDADGSGFLHEEFIDACKTNIITPVCDFEYSEYDPNRYTNVFLVTSATEIKIIECYLPYLFKIIPHT